MMGYTQSAAKLQFFMARANSLDVGQIHP